MASRYTDEWLQLEQALGTRPVLKGSALEIREQFSGLVGMIESQLPPKDNEAIKTTDGSVGEVKYRIYNPTATSTPLPVGIYTHSGGLVAGSVDADDRACRFIAEQTPCVVISVEYRLAPEHKLPAQMEDALAVAKWALSSAASFNGDASKLFTIGTSAGAGLALGIANQFAKTVSTAKENPVKGVVALGPTSLHPDHVPAEYRPLYKSYEENAVDVPVIDRSVMDVFYTALGADPTDPDVFVALSPHLAKFPPVYIVSCDTDVVRDDSTVIEAALKKNGVPTKHDFYPKLPHCFWMFPSLVEANKNFFGNLVQGTKWVVASM